MHIQSADLRPPRRLSGIAATVAVHVLVVGAAMLTRDPEPDDMPAGPAIQWINVKLPQPRPIPPPAAARPVATQQAARRAGTTAPLAEPAVAAPATAASPAQPVPMAEPTTGAAADDPAAAARTADDIMQQARRDIGSISKDLKKEFPQRGIRAPIDTAHKRLVKGIALAHELAPPKWYEQAKVKELIDPGGQGRRRYRVMTAGGPMCWTVDAQHTPNGRDLGKPQGAPKMTNCPPDEEPAKAQEWE